MSSNDDPNNARENLGRIFDQHYSHSRHQETQRLTFTTILTAVLGAIVTFTGSNFANSLGAQSNSLFILIFTIGWALSFIGFILMYTWNKPFIRHYTLAEMIVVYKWNLRELSRLPVLGNGKRKTIADHLLEAIKLIFLFHRNAQPKSDIGYYGLKIKAKDWNIEDVLLEATSGNIFYVLMALYNFLFAALIAYAIPGLVNQQIFWTYVLQILVICGSIFALVRIRIYFAYEELKTRKETMDRFDKKYGSQDGAK